MLFNTIVMRKLFVIGFMFSALMVFGQEQLVVKYKYTAELSEGSLEISSDSKKIDPDLQKAINEAMTEPKYYTLRLTATESEFRKEEKIDNSQPKDGIKISISMGGESTIYKNFEEDIYLNSRPLGNKDFLVKDSLKVYQWKISRDSKEVSGYEVRKAEFSDSTQNVTAWYAPALPFKNGPQMYQGLPGLILELQVERIKPNKKKGMTSVFSAYSIEIDKNPSVIERPKKGKEISEEDFKKASREQFEKMKQMRSGGVDTD